MVPKITSLAVTNFFECDFEVDIEQKSESTLCLISGQKRETKEAVANAIAFCFTGILRYDGHLTQWVTDDLSTPSVGGDRDSGSVTIEVTDGAPATTRRLSRTVHEIPTGDDRERFIDPVSVDTQTASGWNHTSPRIATAQLYPGSATQFTFLDGGSVLAQSGETKNSSATHKLKWSDFLEVVLRAGRRQATARDVKLPEYYANTDALSDEIVDRINASLSKCERYKDYPVAATDGDLVIYQEFSDQRMEAAPATGHWTLVSHLACLIAGDIMPSPPPLIGTDMFGRCDPEIQSHLSQHITASNRQAILLLTDMGADRSQSSPDFHLTQPSNTFHIESV